VVKKDIIWTPSNKLKNKKIYFHKYLEIIGLYGSVAQFGRARRSQCNFDLFVTHSFLKKFINSVENRSFFVLISFKIF